MSLPGNWNEVPSRGFATVICHPKQLISCEAVLFRETSTLGIVAIQQRRLSREIQEVETEYGIGSRQGCLDRQRGREGDRQRAARI